MNLRILLTFIFICAQLFFYSALCADNHSEYKKNLLVEKNFIIDAEKNGMLNKSSNDGHFVCQNNSLKSITSHKESNNGFISSVAPSFRLDFSKKVSYFYKNNFLTINCTKLVYLTEINSRAP